MSNRMSEFNGPRSRCTCGHTGDGDDSQHASTVSAGIVVEGGHGGCMVDGCDCQQFAWDGFLPEYELTLKKP